MSDLRPLLAQLWDADASKRSSAMRAIVEAPRTSYDQKVVQALVGALDHDDYEMQEWAASALSRCRDDRRVVEALSAGGEGERGARRAGK